MHPVPLPKAVERIHPARLIPGLAGLAALALVCSCATGRYVYRPEDNAAARASGSPAAIYQVPAQTPRGLVRVAALGITTLEPRNDDKDRIHAMHVRLVVDNNDDTAVWQVDTRQQIGSLDGNGQSRAAFAASNRGQPPILSIGPGTSATIDLYYPLPSSMQRASEVPAFGVLWSVHTEEGTVVQRTSFQRLRVEPPRPADFYAWGGPVWWGWGPGWYDPLWPEYAFSGSPVLPYPYYERPVVMRPMAPGDNR